MAAENIRSLRASMPTSARILLVLGAVFAIAGVGMGAFGAHALKARLSPEMLGVWRTAVQYHLFHALGLIAVGLAALHLPRSILLQSSGWAMGAGILLFSGSLYALALSGPKWLGALTPLGGTAFLLAWALFAAAVARAG